MFTSNQNSYLLQPRDGGFGLAFFFFPEPSTGVKVRFFHEPVKKPLSRLNPTSCEVPCCLSTLVFFPLKVVLTHGSVLVGQWLSVLAAWS